MLLSNKAAVAVEGSCARLVGSEVQYIQYTILCMQSGRCTQFSCTLLDKVSMGESLLFLSVKAIECFRACFGGRLLFARVDAISCLRGCLLLARVDAIA